MSKIILKRYIKLFNPKMADGNIKITVDGINYGQLPWRENMEIELPHGEHELKATLRFEPDTEFTFELNENEVKTFYVQTNPAKRRIILLFVFLSIPGSILFRNLFNPVTNTIWVVSILLSIVPVVAANLFLYRKNSLVFVEEK